MKKRVLLAAALLPLLSGCGGTFSTGSLGHMFSGSSNISDYNTPQGFLVQAAAARAKQEATAEIALKRTHNPQLRAYAQHVLNDAKADDPALAALSKTYNVKFPAPITPEDQDEIDTLNGVAPAVFDKFYMDASMNDERDMLDMYTAAANRNAADVAQYAQGQRVKLRSHFDDAVRLDALVGGQLYEPYNE